MVTEVNTETEVKGETKMSSNGYLAGSTLERVLRAGHFAVTGELGPPQSADGEEIRKKAALLKGYCDAVNITDNQTAIVRMSSIGAGTIVVQEGLEPVIQMTCRDRNRLAIQADLMGAYALGMRNLLCLTGDHQIFGNHPTAKNVFDLDSLQVDRHARLPVSGGDQVLGDLVVADEETIYTTDSVDGPVYRFSVSNSEFSTLVPRGVFGSPQGLVLDASGEHLYVADYIGGLYRVRLDDGTATRLAVPADISDYGIDGLYRHGNRLIAIQNGIRPHRVAALTLSTDGLAIESAEVLAMNLPEFDEPTLGTIVGDDFYFIANSHWNRFDQDNKLPDDLSGPIVLKIKL